MQQTNDNSVTCTNSTRHVIQLWPCLQIYTMTILHKSQIQNKQRIVTADTRKICKIFCPN